MTRKVAAGDPLQIAEIKGWAAGTVNLAIAVLLEGRLPGGWTILAAGMVGFLGYGLSLVLFVLALRHLGTARTGAYFSLAPFIGVAVALPLLEETPGPLFWLAAVLMGAGLWLHLIEHHEHLHAHEALSHSHRHGHDEHHQHDHDFPWDSHESHTHFHYHDLLLHSHPHFPDIHHRHQH